MSVYFLAFTINTLFSAIPLLCKWPPIPNFVVSCFPLQKHYNLKRYPNFLSFLWFLISYYSSTAWIQNLSTPKKSYIFFHLFGTNPCGTFLNLWKQWSHFNLVLMWDLCHLFMYKEKIKKWWIQELSVFHFASR